MSAPRWFLIYDSRALDDVDSATVMEACAPPETLRDAIKAAPTHGHCVIFSYADTDPLSDERREWVAPELRAESDSGADS